MRKSKSTTERRYTCTTQSSSNSPAKKKDSAQSTDNIPEDIEDILRTVSMKKPKPAYHIYLMEMKEKNNKLRFMDLSKICSKNWAGLPDTERNLYVEMANEDKVRFETEVSLVKRYILDKPLPPGASAYQLYVDDYVKKETYNEADPKQATKEANLKWQEMPETEKFEWQLKEKEHEEWWQEISKTTWNAVTSYSVFHQEKLEKTKTIPLNAIRDDWRGLKSKDKKRYQNQCKEINEKMRRDRDMYEFALGMKPQAPANQYMIFLEEAKQKDASDGAMLWGHLSNLEKEKYKKLAHKAKLAYKLKKLEHMKHGKSRVRTGFDQFVEEQFGKNGEDDISVSFGCYWKEWWELNEHTKKDYQERANKKQVLSQSDKRAREIRKPLSTYYIYIRDVFWDIKNANPNKPPKALFTLAAERWKTMSDKEKEKYRAQYNKAKAEYEDNVIKKVYNTSSNKRKSEGRGTSQGRSKRGKKAK